MGKVLSATEPVGTVRTFGGGNNIYTFTVTSANATFAATFTTPNANVFTVVTTIASGTVLVTTGTGAPNAGPNTLTRTGGSGDATIAYSAFSLAGIPGGYLLCDGTSYPRATYPDLFAVISTVHGAVDNTHFNVPDYRGKFLRGADTAAGNDPDRATRTAAKTGGVVGDAVGSVQSDGLGAHGHPQEGAASGLSGGLYTVLGNFANYDLGSTSANTTKNNNGATGDTRPKNAGVNYIIKY